jgi:flagellar biosynthesis protein FlhF
MKLKSYFSGTVEAAIDLARRELGEDALLVHARPSTPETRSLGAFEIVFGLPEGARENTASLSSAGSTANSGANSSTNAASAVNGGAASQDRLVQEVSELKRQMERMGQSLRYPRPLPASGSKESALYVRLLEADLEPALAQQVAQGTPLEDLFETDATLGRGTAAPGAPPGHPAARAPGGSAPGPIIVTLIGPPGAGKTTTLIKLAARYGLTSRRPSRILSIDVRRIAAADQLRTLAAILGMGCDVVETPSALAQAIEEYRNKDYIFIDTPGYAGTEMDEARDLAALFASQSEIDTHLVLPASMKPLDLTCTIDRYEMFSPHKLIFTRMDETESFGPLINESARRSLPVSFLSAGQNIPDDLEPASKQGLADRVRGRDVLCAGAAA